MDLGDGSGVTDGVLLIALLMIGVPCLNANLNQSTGVNAEHLASSQVTTLQFSIDIDKGCLRECCRMAPDAAGLKRGRQGDSRLFGGMNGVGARPV